MKKVSFALSIAFVLFSLCACFVKGIITPIEKTDEEYCLIYITLETVDYEKQALNVKWRNNSSYSVSYGHPYEIERKSGDNWLNIRTADVNYPMEEFILSAGGEAHKGYTLTDFKLNKRGIYRLRTSCVINDGVGTQLTLTFEFTVK